MTLTIPTTPDAVESAAFTTGADIELGATDARLSLTTEGGVRLVLVAPLSQEVPC